MYANRLIKENFEKEEKALVSRSLEQKIDRLILLLEEQELASYRKTCNSNKKIGLDLATNTILASMVGYFLFRIMDAHFRGKPITGTRKKRR